MAWKIYKPGQGYYTRLLSAIGAGVLVIAGVDWIWKKLSTLKAESFNVVYLQAGVAVAILALFGLLFYRWIGVKPRTSDFLIATEGEMKKVNWPTRKEVVGSTWVVVCCMVLLVALLFVADISFAWLFRQMGILEQ
ncbi:MAG: preprotein translocase subunit SecE [Phycisphaerae bacterium]|nr:preprotein translocase subunit SecE [Phycisphaerae bacterium]